MFKKNYEFVFDDILNIAKKNDAIKVTKDIQSKKFGSKNLEDRNDAYTELTFSYVKNYEETHRQKRILKLCFFIIVMTIYSLIILGSMFAIIYSLVSGKGNLEIIIGSVVSLITTVATIPIIIARYLFPKGEDKQMGKMINKMQEHDYKISTIIDSNLNKED